MSRLNILVLLLVLAGCDFTDPYRRAGIWRPVGANEANLRAMMVAPSDLAVAAPSARADGGMAAAAIRRLRQDRVRPLLDSGLAQIVPVASPPAAQPAAATPGNSE